MRTETFTPYFRTLLLLLSFCCATALTAQNDCNIRGGSLTSADGLLFTSVCLDDGTSTAADVALSGNTAGTSTQFFATTPNGTILAVLDGAPPFEVAGIDEDAVVIFSVSYTGDLIGAMVGLNICNLMSTTGCVAMSNPVVFNRREGDDCNNNQVCDADGGMLELTAGGTSTSVCIDNEGEGLIDVTLSGTPVGENMTFLITDDQGNILAIPDGNGPFDLTPAGPGTCLIWYLSYEDDLTGLATGNNADDFEGCFALSNPVTVDRLTGEDCGVMGENNFVAVLNGINELPCPVTTTGFGNVTAMLNGNTLSVAGDFGGLTSDFDPNVAGGAHLHTGMAGTGGPVVFRLTTDLDDDLRGGSFSADANSFELTDEQVAAVRARGIYVNIHSLDHPAGEIRGQLVPAGADDYRAAYLLGVNEVPAVVTPAIGAVIVERYGDSIVVSGSFSGLMDTVATAIAGGAHIHMGIAGRNGPVIIPLTLDLNDDRTGATLMAAANTFAVDEAMQMAMRNDMLYVNIHSGAVPSGELRGQVAAMGVAQFYSNPSGHQARPVAMNTPGNGRLLLSLDDDNNLTVSGSVNDLLEPVDQSIAGGAHLHLNIAGSNGPIVFELSYTEDSEGNGGQYMARDNVFSLTDEQVAAFMAREYYANIHTFAAPSGEVRGQVMNLAKGYFGSNLAGINENPAAVKTTGGGFVMYELCGGFVTATGSFANLSSDFNAEIAGGSHVHLGDAASAGPIAFRLNAEVSDDLRSGVYRADSNRVAIDDAGMAAMLAGNYYFNLHTVDFASGEIRGQILRDDNSFPEAVEVIAPEDGATITVFEGGSDLEEGAFTGADDPDGDLVVYTIEITLPTDTNFAEVLVCEKVGTDTLSFASLDAVYDSLIAFGAFPGVSVDLRYRVIASDGSVATPGGSRSITFRVGDSSCEADGGTLTFADGTTETTICVGDGVIDSLAVTLTDTVGTNFVYVVTDATGQILDLPADQPFVLEGAGPGTCLIWALSFEDGLGGATIGANASGLTGCFDLSDPLTVIRNSGADCDTDTCDVDGGMLTFASGSVDTTICVGEGFDDLLDVTITGQSGDNFAWVITDDQGIILGLPMAPPFSLEGAGPGTCLIWGLSFDDDFVVPAVGDDATMLEGCFELSNSISAVRNTGDDCDGCDVDGGMLTFASGSVDTTICVGEGVDDLLDVTVTGETGDNFAWVITDSDGIILGLPAAPPFNLEGAGPGTCLIWGLSFDDDFVVPAVGDDATMLEGCFDLSDPISAVRNTGADCDACNVDGGLLTFANGTVDTVICVGEGVDDLLDVAISDTTAPNFAWVITDDQGIILGLPMAPPFSLEGAGAGTCLIWGLAFDDDFVVPAVGDDATMLEGCFDLSNPLTAVRNTGDDCNMCDADGGVLAFASGAVDTTICVGEGTDDLLDVTVTGATGANFAWVITDASGIILGLPAAPPFNLEGAGAGTCLIWGLSFDDDFEVPAVGDDATMLEGCFDLSEPISAERLTGDDCDTIGDACDADGGILSFLSGSIDTTICAGEGVDDLLEVTLTDTVGANFTYVITDDSGIILGLPANQPFNLEDAGAGTCLIWSLTFDDNFQVPAVGDDATMLTGCFSLSDPLTVVRNTGDDCTDGLVTINEVDRNGAVEIVNLTNSTVDVGLLYLGSNNDFIQIQDMMATCGQLNLKPGEFLVIESAMLIDAAGDELALTNGNSYATSTVISSYVAWGESERAGEEMAVEAGVWAADTELEGPNSAVSLQRIPDTGTYALGAPTLCETNSLTVGTINPAADRLSVYPNPFSDRVTLEVSGLRGASELTILDIAGRVVVRRDLEAGATRLDLITTRLKAGTYLLRLTNEAGISTARMVRQ